MYSSNEHTIYILSYFIFNISMIECLILILNAYYYFLRIIVWSIEWQWDQEVICYFSSRIKHH